MLEVLTGTVLASAAGLNAYIPLLGLGLLARFTSLLTLPPDWIWLQSGWVLVVLAALLLVEILVDKFPALDTVNDVLQSVIRPASGGLAFSAGASSETVAVSDPSALLDTANLWPFLTGVGVALIPHILKLLARPAANAVTAGAAAPVLSTLEDILSVTLTVLAVVVPLVALALVVLIICWLVRSIRRYRRKRAHTPVPPPAPLT